MSYTNIFGGFNINTAFPSYQSFTFFANLQLTWASSFVDNSNVTAQINDLNATQPNLTVTLANATLISVGQTVQFNNVGTEDIDINDFEGGFIATIPPTNNNQYILYLKDNSTPAGTWGITHLGAGTSAADANALAGAGTIALNGTINTNFIGKTINANYQVATTDRAQILVSTGGALTVTLPPTGTLPAQGGYYIAINNQGSGTVTVTTPDAKTIDGALTFQVNPGQSSYFINVLSGAGLNWNSLGFGTTPNFLVRTFSINLFPFSGGSVTLTPVQSANLVQVFTSTPNLTGNVTVFFPAAPGQWYMTNNSAGANVTVQLAGPTGNPILLPPGERIIVYSDGTTMYNTPTIQTNVLFGDGTAGAPGIAFASDPTTGFYYTTPGNHSVSVSSGGVPIVQFGNTAQAGISILNGLSFEIFNGSNTNSVGFEAPIPLLQSISWSLPPSDATVAGQLLRSDALTHLSFTQTSYPNTIASGSLLFASAANTVTGLAPTQFSILASDVLNDPFWLSTNINDILTSDNIGQPTWISKSLTIPPAFVRFTGTGVILNQKNVTSVTVNSAGNYTINFTSALSTATYLSEITCQSTTFASGQEGITHSTTQLQVLTFNSGGVPVSPNVINVVIFGA